MNATKKIWQNGALVNWDQATTHVMGHTLHYGGGAFEGIRCYEAADGTAIFRLAEHTERLFYSARAVGIEIPYKPEEINRACCEVVAANELKEGYIRPIVFYGLGGLSIHPKDAPIECAIGCWPWGKYLGSGMVRIKTSKFIRIHPQTSVTDAKICGHYVNSIHAALEIQDDDRYDETIFLDYEGNVAEGGGQNLFLVKNNVLITPRGGTILMGITRQTVIELAKERGYETDERVVQPQDVYDADECFFSGTATEVCGIASLDDRPIGNGEMGPVTSELKEAYQQAVRGRLPEHVDWLTYV